MNENFPFENLIHLFQEERAGRFSDGRIADPSTFSPEFVAAINNRIEKLLELKIAWEKMADLPRIRRQKIQQMFEKLELFN